MKVDLSLDLHDLWVGVFWRIDEEVWDRQWYSIVHVYICLLPAVPLHLRFRLR